MIGYRVIEPHASHFTTTANMAVYDIWFIWRSRAKQQSTSTCLCQGRIYNIACHGMHSFATIIYCWVCEIRECGANFRELATWRYYFQCKIRSSLWHLRWKRRLYERHWRDTNNGKYAWCFFKILTLAKNLVVKSSRNSQKNKTSYLVWKFKLQTLGI